MWIPHTISGQNKPWLHFLWSCCKKDFLMLTVLLYLLKKPKKISFFVQCLHYKLYEALLSKYETTTLLQHLQNSCLQTEYRTAATVWGLMMKITNTRKTLFFSRKNQLGQIVYWNKVIVQRQMLQQLVYLISVCKKSY